MYFIPSSCVPDAQINFLLQRSLPTSEYWRLRALSKEQKREVLEKLCTGVEMFWREYGYRRDWIEWKGFKRIDSRSKKCRFVFQAPVSAISVEDSEGAPYAVLKTPSDIPSWSREQIRDVFSSIVATKHVAEKKEEKQERLVSLGENMSYISSASNDAPIADPKPPAKTKQEGIMVDTERDVTWFEKYKSERRPSFEDIPESKFAKSPEHDPNAVPTSGFPEREAVYLKTEGGDWVLAKPSDGDGKSFEKDGKLTLYRWKKEKRLFTKRLFGNKALRSEILLLLRLWALGLYSKEYLRTNEQRKWRLPDIERDIGCAYRPTTYFLPDRAGEVFADSLFSNLPYHVLHGDSKKKLSSFRLWNWESVHSTLSYANYHNYLFGQTVAPHDFFTDKVFKSCRRRNSSRRYLKVFCQEFLRDIRAFRGCLFSECAMFLNDIVDALCPSGVSRCAEYSGWLRRLLLGMPGKNGQYCSPIHSVVSRSLYLYQFLEDPKLIHRMKMSSKKRVARTLAEQWIMDPTEYEIRINVGYRVMLDHVLKKEIPEKLYLLTTRKAPSPDIFGISQLVETITTTEKDTAEWSEKNVIQAAITKDKSGRKWLESFDDPRSYDKLSTFWKDVRGNVTWVQMLVWLAAVSGARTIELVKWSSFHTVEPMDIQSSQICLSPQREYLLKTSEDILCHYIRQRGIAKQRTTQTMPPVGPEVRTILKPLPGCVQASHFVAIWRAMIVAMSRDFLKTDAGQSRFEDENEIWNARLQVPNIEIAKFKQGAVARCFHKVFDGIAEPPQGEKSQKFQFRHLRPMYGSMVYRQYGKDKNMSMLYFLNKVLGHAIDDVATAQYYETFFLKETSDVFVKPDAETIKCWYLRMRDIENTLGTHCRKIARFAENRGGGKKRKRVKVDPLPAAKRRWKKFVAKGHELDWDITWTNLHDIGINTRKAGAYYAVARSQKVLGDVTMDILEKVKDYVMLKENGVDVDLSKKS